MIGGQSVGTLLCIKYVLEGNFSVGDYVMFGTYMSQLYRPVSRMVNMSSIYKCQKWISTKIRITHVS